MDTVPVCRFWGLLDTVVGRPGRFEEDLSVAVSAWKESGLARIDRDNNSNCGGRKWALFTENTDAEIGLFVRFYNRVK
jgi:hypothetical protein